MKNLLIIIGILTAFISACSSHEAEPYPVETYTKYENVVPKTTIDNRVFTELKSENSIPADEEVCEIITGCEVTKKGKCIGCVTKKRDISTLEYDGGGSLREGDYRITTLMEHTGKITRWTIPLKMSLRNISKRTYLMTFSGIGKVEGNRIDCSEPLVAMFSIDDNNIETSFRVLDGGSCSGIVSNTHKVKWESNEYGLKKMKSYSKGGECVVGPCDWISTMINVYFYERI